MRITNDELEKFGIFDKLTSVFHAYCLVIDHEFRHNIVKAAVAEWIRRLLWQCYDEIHCQ